jgi:hypothetical protein
MQRVWDNNIFQRSGRSNERQEMEERRRRKLEKAGRWRVILDAKKIIVITMRTGDHPPDCNDQQKACVNKT